MKKETLLIGFVVIVGFLIVIFLGFYMNKIKIVLNNNYAYLKFPNTDGLVVNDEVRLRGVKCGSVRQITLYDDFVLVKIALDKGRKLTKDAQISIQSLALIGGTKYLLLIPSNGDIYKFPEDTLIGINAGFDMGKFVIMFDDFKNKLEKILPSDKSIQDVLDTLGNTISHINTLIVNTGEDVHSILSDVQGISKSLNGTIDTISVLVNQIRDEIAYYKEHDNTVKSFVSDDSLYIKLEKSIEQLNNILQKANKNKFIKGCL